MSRYCKINLVKQNISSIISEISGSVGDIGTFLPLTISLVIVTKGEMSFNFILLSTGIFNILNGIIFKLPMPLQPMKAIVAEAITKNIDNLYVICSAGLVVGGVLSRVDCQRKERAGAGAISHDIKGDNGMDGEIRSGREGAAAQGV